MNGKTWEKKPQESWVFEYGFQRGFMNAQKGLELSKTKQFSGFFVK